MRCAPRNGYPEHLRDSFQGKNYYYKNFVFPEVLIHPLYFLADSECRRCLTLKYELKFRPPYGQKALRSDTAQGFGAQAAMETPT
jgi:hypothetical protein